MTTILCIRCVASHAAKQKEATGQKVGGIFWAEDPAAKEAAERDADHVLVCSEWPGILPGCEKFECDSCHADVAVSPGSLWMLEGRNAKE